jgi:hypothetical protein
MDTPPPKIDENGGPQMFRESLKFKKRSRDRQLDFDGFHLFPTINTTVPGEC